MLIKKYKLKTRSTSQLLFSSGLCDTGLTPLSHDHVLGKLSPLAVAGDSTSDGQRTSKITRTSCGHEVTTTPVVKTHIVSCFTGFLEIRMTGRRLDKVKDWKVRVEGEAITFDVFMDLLETQRASKEEEQKQKQGYSQ